MKKTEIEYKGKKYSMTFNLNVMEEIQNEYGSVAEWGELTDDSEGKEPNAKAVIFGLTAMINEGIEIENEDNAGVEGYVAKKTFNHKQVGRIISEIGFDKATNKLNEAVINDATTEEKN